MWILYQFTSKTTVLIFHEVRIIEEKTYPLEYIISEDATQEIVKSLDMTLEEVKEAANSVVIVKVSAEKTN